MHTCTRNRAKRPILPALLFPSTHRDLYRGSHTTYITFPVLMRRCLVTSSRVHAYVFLMSFRAPLGISNSKSCFPLSCFWIFQQVIFFLDSFLRTGALEKTYYVTYGFDLYHFSEHIFCSWFFLVFFCFVNKSINKRVNWLSVGMKKADVLFSLQTSSLLVD